jgi:hypothetical protein
VTAILLAAALAAPVAAQDQSQASAESLAASPACPQRLAGTEAAHVAPAGDPTLATDSSTAEAPPPACTLAQTAVDLAAPDQVSLALDSYKYAGGAAIPAETISNDTPVSDKRGKWGGEQWRPAILQALGFTIGQNAYRYATEEKTRKAITLETWHRYWLAVTGLHTWSDGGKTWTVYVAHPAQGAVFVDIWTEHDPHGVLVPFGSSHAYWISRWKALWWNAAWELQWKFGPFSEASIGNVGLIPGKLGANTIVSTVTIGTGLSIGEDMMDRYVIAKLEKKTQNRAGRALLRTWLNPDRSFANLLRWKHPWYRDTRPSLRDTAP